MSWLKRKDNKDGVNKERSAVKVVADTVKKGMTDKKSVAVTGVKYPLSSEKSVRLQSNGQYTFVVADNLSKVQLKKEIEKIYGVKVEKVTSVNLPGKIVINRGREGFRSPRRYMRIKLATGQSLDLTKF